VAYPPGTKVGKFEIKSELGRGAMGIVYVAYDALLDRDVALKVMAAPILDDPDLKARFQREAQAVAKLQSPNIVTVYDFGYDHQEAPYIAMELLSGIDLEAKLRDDPPTLSGKINILIQVCRGLSHAHQKGIVHRDIKPANIFLTRSGLVKIMDFGTARLLQSSHTQTGTVMGTVAYMSPEQIQGEKVDGRSDVFSLGIVLYRLLCHQQPFHGDNVHHIIYQILNVQPASLTMPGGMAIPPLQLIVDRALAKDAGKRYQSADEMAADLTDFLRSAAGSLTEDTVFRTVPLDAVAAQPPPMTGPPDRGLAPTVVELELRGEDATVKFGAQAAAAAPRWTSPARLAAVALLIAAVAAGGFFAARYFGRGGAESAGVTADAGTPPGDAGVAPTTDETPGAAGVAPPGDAGIAPTNGDALASPPPPVTVPPPPVTAPPPPVTAPPPRAALPPPPAADSRADEARQTAAAARTAISGGDLERARTLIGEGRTAAPADPAWAQLETQLRAAEKNAEGSGHLRRGVELFAAGRPAEAAAAYDQALAVFGEADAIAPGNAAALDGKVAATRYKRDAEQAQQQSAVARRRFTETETVRIAASGGAAADGFVDDAGLAVQRATSDAAAPGELSIELVPEDARPGVPYAVRVRLRNKSHSVLFAKSLELVSSYKGKQIGKGNEIHLGLRRIDAQDSAVLQDIQDRWTEDLDSGGKITATVTLSDDSRLTKTLEWTSSP
jgi:serine/threonine-protein kinase